MLALITGATSGIGKSTAEIFAKNGYDIIITERRNERLMVFKTEFSIVRFDGDKDKAKKVHEGLQPLSPEDIAETIFWVATRPADVNINDIVIMPTVQASATNVIHKIAHDK